MNQELMFQLALSNLYGIGFQRIKEIYRVFKNFEDFFMLDKKEVKKILKISNEQFDSWNYSLEFEKAEKELEFCIKNNIQVCSFIHDSYPYRLKECYDAPNILFSKGNFELNSSKIIAVVGTRNISKYGEMICEDLISELRHFDCKVISGLAYGVDTKIHQLCLENNIPTIGVLAHGLDIIYPKIHQHIATKMIEQKGGVITEFKINTNPNRENFPKRNRIVAGLVDAVVVVESGLKGGSLITCNIANGYNRDVFAYPGNIFSKFSKGCNYLIKQNKANMICSGKDLIHFMGWKKKSFSKVIQKKLFIDLSEFEEKIIANLRQNKLSINQLSIKTSSSISKLSAKLLELEIKGIVKSKPGNFYELV